MSERSEKQDFQQWRQYGIDRGWLKETATGARRNSVDSDEWLGDEIYAQLTHNRDLDASDIDVEVSKGNVLLKGFVDNKFEKHLAEQIAAAIEGVKKVTNDLKFKQFGFPLPSDSKRGNATKASEERKPVEQRSPARPKEI